MPGEQPSASELAEKVFDAKAVWENAKLHREQADTEYEYAEKLLVLARRELSLALQRLGPDEDWQHEVTQGSEYPAEALAELDSVEFVGASIGEASRFTLARVRKATVNRLVTYMKGRGFQFATDVPSREVHGALLKQPWASKDSKTNEWVFLKGNG